MMLRALRFFWALVTALALAVPARAVECHTHVDGLPRLKWALGHVRFVAYHPTAMRVWNGHVAKADPDSIRADLKTLRPWFDGLITYTESNGGERVADIAAQLGYRAVILGIWNPDDPREIDSALAAIARHPKLIVGIGLGNEVVLWDRGTWGDLAYNLRRLRERAPHIPLGVTEPFNQYLDDPDAVSTLREMDFMLANVHPIFQPWFRKAQPSNWADFVVKVSDMLAKKFCGPVIVKETGVPTGPANLNFTPQMQTAFYTEMQKQMPRSAMHTFAYFTAFDQRWHAFDADPKTGKPHPEEAYWGLFTEERRPKPFVETLPRLVPERAAGAVRAGR